MGKTSNDNRLTLAFLVLLAACALYGYGGNSTAVNVCLDMTGLFAADDLYLVGREIDLNIFGQNTGEYPENVSFYRFEKDQFIPEGVFRGTFASANVLNDTIYVVEGNSGVMLFSASAEGIKYSRYINPPEGIMFAEIALLNNTVYLLGIDNTSSSIKIYRLNEENDTSISVYPELHILLKSASGIRFVFIEEKPAIAWMEHSIAGVRFSILEKNKWQSYDFSKVKVNHFDLNGDGTIYLSEIQKTNKENLIGFTSFRGKEWSGVTAIPGSEPGFARKYQNIRVTEGGANKKIIVRSHYLPFGINSSDLLTYRSGKWNMQYAGQRVIPFLFSTLLFVICVAICIAKVIRKWFPFLLYQKVQSIQVGSLLGRLMGYMIDFALVAVGAVIMAGFIDFQDVPIEVFKYLFYIIFISVLFVYSFSIELLTGFTIGKMITGLRLRNNIGMKCGLREVAIRNIFKIFEIHLWIVPAFFILFTKENKRLGDLIAGTRVQKTGD